jgi:hypothetical protein
MDITPFLVNYKNVLSLENRYKNVAAFGVPCQGKGWQRFGPAKEIS